MAEYQMTLSIDRESPKNTNGVVGLTPMMPASNSDLGGHADLPSRARATEDAGDDSRTFSVASSPHDKSPIMIAMRMQRLAFRARCRLPRSARGSL